MVEILLFNAHRIDHIWKYILEVKDNKTQLDVTARFWVLDRHTRDGWMSWVHFIYTLEPKKKAICLKTYSHLKFTWSFWKTTMFLTQYCFMFEPATKQISKDVWI